MALEQRLPLGYREDFLVGVREGLRHDFLKPSFMYSSPPPSTQLEIYGRFMGKAIFRSSAVALVSLALYFSP